MALNYSQNKRFFIRRQAQFIRILVKEIKSFHIKLSTKVFLRVFKPSQIFEFSGKLIQMFPLKRSLNISQN